MPSATGGLKARRSTRTIGVAPPDARARCQLPRRTEPCRLALADPKLADRSITEIALAFGFSNPAHFSRVFRSHSGVSPSAYRHAVTQTVRAGLIA